MLFSAVVVFVCSCIMDEHCTKNPLTPCFFHLFTSFFEASFSFNSLGIPWRVIFLPSLWKVNPRGLVCNWMGAYWSIQSMPSTISHPLSMSSLNSISKTSFCTSHLKFLQMESHATFYPFATVTNSVLAFSVSFLKWVNTSGSRKLWVLPLSTSIISFFLLTYPTSLMVFMPTPPTTAHKDTSHSSCFPLSS